MTKNNIDHQKNDDINQLNNKAIVLSPFHQGEQILQTRTGKREEVESMGRKAVRPFMPDQHREFYEKLPFIIIGSVDDEGWPWASILPGNANFIVSPTPTTLTLKSSAILGDPLATALQKIDAPLGLLGIEPSTRRRNRVNGRISESSNNEITVKVDQSFGNCPQYIQHRSVNFIREAGEVSSNYSKQTFTTLDKSACALINAADTFFVSSAVKAKYRPEIEGVDVSHRGGRPGFVKIEQNTLTIPDYPGNYLFNTLGNFLVNPKGGLIFVDFITGELLMLTGTVELLWDVNEDIQAFKGAERAWRFTLDHGIRLKDALPFRLTLGEFSPNTLLTGNWAEAAEIRRAQEQQNTFRPFSVYKIKEESNDIRSFYLKPNDNGALLPFEAGQYLTIKIYPSATSKALIRTYTISSAPNETYYRISIKKEPNGTISQYLHNNLKQGDVIEVKAPTGNFYINASEKRPAVLIAAGVGITPMISMALHIYNESIRTRYLRPLTIIHGAKTSNSCAFTSEFKKLELLTQHKIRYINVISQPLTSETQGIHFDHSGRINIDTYKQVLSLNNYDFFLCGPTGFMQSQYNALITLSVSNNRIFAEAFGPASIQREDTPITTTDIYKNEEALQSTIKFTKSDIEQQWSNGDKTLLEIAEDKGLTPAFSCRNGNCGACVTQLISGEVVYKTNPTANIKSNEVLICCAIPAENSPLIELDL